MTVTESVGPDGVGGFIITQTRTNPITMAALQARLLSAQNDVTDLTNRLGLANKAVNDVQALITQAQAAGVV